MKSAVSAKEPQYGGNFYERTAIYAGISTNEPQ